MVKNEKGIRIEKLWYDNGEEYEASKFKKLCYENRIKLEKIVKDTFIKWYNKMKEQVWTPHFGSMRFPLDGELEFLFENDFYLLKRNDLESPLMFVLFLKGKQNKKENPKCDSLFWKRWSTKTGSGSGVRLLIGKVR